MRNAFARSSAFSLAKAISIGFRSGLSRRQIKQSRALPIDRFLHSGHVMRREIIHDHDIALGQGGRQILLDVSEEHLAVDRALEQGGRGHASPPQAGDERRGPPFPNGTAPTRRLPRSARPSRRIMLVLVQVSLMKTSLPGSSSGCCLRDSARASATSWRSCSQAE